MLTPLQNVKMQFSHVEFPNLFAPDCEPNDWQFEHVFANFSEPPRVILTASDLGSEQSSGHFTAVVGVAQDVSTTGFHLAGRNSDCSPGVAHMNWLALLETTQPQAPVKHVRMGTLFPKRFHPDCEPGDWNTWDVRFSQPGFTADPVIFATAADRFAETAAVFEHGDFSYWARTNYATPAVPVARKRTTTGFTLMARNPEPDAGWSNFNYVALHETVAVAGAPSGGSGTQLFVDSGQLAPLWFGPCNDISKAWNQWAVTFDQAFLTPPTVLVTAFHPGRVRPGRGWHGLLRHPERFPAARAEYGLQPRRGRLQLGGVRVRSGVRLRRTTKGAAPRSAESQRRRRRNAAANSKGACRGGYEWRAVDALAGHYPLLASELNIIHIMRNPAHTGSSVHLVAARALTGSASYNIWLKCLSTRETSGHHISRAMALRQPFDACGMENAFAVVSCA